MWHDPAVIGAFIQAAATLLTGSIAAVVAGLALRGWRKRALGERKIRLAEECLLEADKFLMRVRAIRSGDAGMAMMSHPLLEPSHGRDRLLRADEMALLEAAAALVTFEGAFRRLTFFILPPRPDPCEEFRAAQSQLERAHKVLFLLVVGDKRTDAHTERQRFRAKVAFHGPALRLDSPESDADLPQETIEPCLQRGMRSLEDALLPILGGKPAPRRSG